MTRNPEELELQAHLPQSESIYDNEPLRSYIWNKMNSPKSLIFHSFPYVVSTLESIDEGTIHSNFKKKKKNITDWAKGQSLNTLHFLIMFILAFVLLL